MCLNIEVGKQKQRIIIKKKKKTHEKKKKKKKKNMIFFFFFGSPPEKLPEVAGVGRPVAVDGGWQRQLVAGDGCWTQIIGLETCIESLIG
jgi:hypothetical protein